MSRICHNSHLYLSTSICFLPTIIFNLFWIGLAFQTSFGELRCLTDEDLRVRSPKLSAGEAQRIALLYTILGDEDVLLLDEPFSAIPEDLIPVLANEIQIACKQKTLLIASHIKIQSMKHIIIKRDR